jgi:hypothetical protein
MADALVKGLVERHGLAAEVSGYKIIPVYGSEDTEARQAVVKMWLDNKILPPQVAAERVKQVVLIITGPAGDVAGVSTVYVGDFSKFKANTLPAGSFYFYRMFIRPQDRIARMSFKTLGLTYDLLNTFPAKPRPQGLVLVTENPKLKKPGSQRLLQKMGWDDIGRNEQGQIIMKRDFATLN